MGKKAYKHCDLYINLPPVSFNAPCVKIQFHNPGYQSLKHVLSFPSKKVNLVQFGSGPCHLTSMDRPVIKSQCATACLKLTMHMQPTQGHTQRKWTYMYKRTKNRAHKITEMVILDKDMV